MPAEGTAWKRAAAAVGITAAVAGLTTTPAAAHGGATEHNGWIYQSNDDVCTRYSNFFDHNVTNVGTISFDDYYIPVYGSLPCEDSRDRPAGNIRVRAQWYRGDNGTRCMYTNYILNTTTTDTVRYDWRGDHPGTCGYSGVISVRSSHHVYNGSWLGGEIYPAYSHNYSAK